LVPSSGRKKKKLRIRENIVDNLGRMLVEIGAATVCPLPLPHTRSISVKMLITFLCLYKIRVGKHLMFPSSKFESLSVLSIIVKFSDEVVCR